MKILALKLRSLGDTVIWTSALQALREWNPAAQLHAAYPSSYGEIFDDELQQFRRWPVGPSLGDQCKILKAWRHEKFDLVLNFHAGVSTACLSTLVGAKEKLIHHHSRRPRRFFSDRPVLQLGQVMPATERDLNVVRTLGWAGTSPAPKVTVGAKRRQIGLELLKEIGWNGSRPLVLLGPTASRSAKQWGLDRYIQLSRLLADKAQVVFVWQPGFALSGYALEQLRASAVVCETATLSDLMSVLTHATCFVGSDSGAKHLAAAMGVSTITLFGPESIGEWHPYDRNIHPILQRSVLCRDLDPVPADFAWCGFSQCPYSGHACLSTISAEEVFEVVLARL